MIIHAAGGIMLFQLTAARRRLGFQRLRLFRLPKFQLTAARRRLGLRMCRLQPQKLFQLTAARRRLVSTVNAPNATCIFQLTAARRRLVCMSIESGAIRDFNSQPREGGWNDSSCGNSILGISTHSRAKAAGSLVSVVQYQFRNFNSQPREGGWFPLFPHAAPHFDFNSQPREGGWLNQGAI